MPMTSPQFVPCDPVSDPAESSRPEEPAPAFCADWNPDFSHNGHRCCATYVLTRRKNANKCAPTRYKTSYCDEMTEEQRRYTDLANAGKLGDVLTLVSSEMGRRGDQAFCSVNNGFLAHGRRLVPSPINRIQLRSPQRCLEFGTDGMVGLLEWVGRQVGKQYSEPAFAGVKLTVGDMSAPRGGCLWGRHGRRGHASHTSGQDADLGFLVAKHGKESPLQFHRQFDAKLNWWLIKQIFKNPFACVKVVFLDQRHINKLVKVAHADEDWLNMRRFIRHMPGHRNHLHLRIGDGPGQPGCTADSKPELETEEFNDTGEGGTMLDELRSSQGATIKQ